MCLINLAHWRYHFSQSCKPWGLCGFDTKRGDRIGKDFDIQAELDMDLFKVGHLHFTASPSTPSQPSQRSLLLVRGLEQLCRMRTKLICSPVHSLPHPACCSVE